MKKNILILFVSILVFTVGIRAEKLAVLSELTNPDAIALDSSRIYITQKTVIYIYSLQDFKLKKKFGRQGEGPGEFKAYAHLTLQPDHLLINSAGKISYFSKEGVPTKELKTGTEATASKFFPLKDGFVINGIIPEGNHVYQTINFFDRDLKEGKAIYRVKEPMQQAGQIELLPTPFLYRTYKDKLFVAAKGGLNIDILDHTGKQLFSINREYKKRKFTGKDERIVKSVAKNVLGRDYDLFKERFVFPSYFPGIQDFFIADDKIYVATWIIEKEKIQFFIFDMKGKLSAKKWIPFVFENALQPYPACILNNKLYQVIENEKTEEWELHMWPISN